MAPQCYDDVDALPQALTAPGPVVPERRVILGVAHVRALHVARAVPRVGRGN